MLHAYWELRLYVGKQEYKFKWRGTPKEAWILCSIKKGWMNKGSLNRALENHGWSWRQGIPLDPTEDTGKALANETREDMAELQRRLNATVTQSGYTAGKWVRPHPAWHMEAFTREEVWVDSLVYYGSLHTYVPVPFKIPPYTDSGFSYLAPFHKRGKKKTWWIVHGFIPWQSCSCCKNKPTDRQNN